MVAVTTTREPPLGAAAKARLAVEIVGAYVHARRRLRRAGLQAALQDLRRMDAPRPAVLASADDLATCRRLARAVVHTLHVLPADSRCLMQSLVLTRLLARRGIDTQLAISVRPGKSFAAHAWVEREGVALLPGESPSFERLVML
jgi:hypothetical protein